MSKRASSTTTTTTTTVIRPTKLVKQANVWSIIQDDDDKAKEFKPVEGGPKTKLQKSFVLNYNPRVDVSITLNGCYPEVRFSNPDGCFYMTGSEFLNIASTQQTSKDMDCVKMEQTEEGFRLARYLPTESGLPALFTTAALELNKYAAKRLKTKLEAMCEHVSTLIESESVIRLMFDCVADVYKNEYQLSDSLTPLSEQFSELSRVVDTYVPTSSIVKSFLDKMHDSRLLSRFNHYNLCAITMSQKHFILALLK